MSKPIKTHLEKNSFIAILAGFSPTEINVYLRKNGKVKRINPIQKVNPFTREEENQKQEEL